MIEYIFKKGDTLRSVAEKYGISIDEMLKIVKDRVISEGSKILIPDGEGVQEKEFHTETIQEIGDIKSSIERVIESIKNIPEPKETFKLEGIKTLFEGLSAIEEKINALESKIFSVKIENHQPYPEKIKVEEINPVKEVKVTNFDLPEKFDIKGMKESLELLEKILGKDKVEITNSDPKKPIPVVLSDGKEIYKAVTNVVSNNALVKAAVDRVYDKLTQVYLEVKNQATKEKQDEMIEAIENIELDTSTLATESTLSEIKDKVTEDVAKTITYNLDGTIATIVKVVGGVTYTKTLTYTDGNVTNVSAWVAS